MKSYACYPNARNRYQAPVMGFVNPYFPRFTQETAKQNMVANRPAANIIREEAAYKIQLAVPGFSKEQIKIELQDDQLIITGSASAQDDNIKSVRKEFDYSGFKRTFRLHKNANTAAMTAGFEQGILTIVIPDASPETININIQ
jgi:HSP20 family molecular chaperone IbpA